MELENTHLPLLLFFIFLYLFFLCVCAHARAPLEVGRQREGTGSLLPPYWSWIGLQVWWQTPFPRAVSQASPLILWLGEIKA